MKKKILRNYGRVGHIEDIVVDKKLRGYGLGSIIVKHLVDISESLNCYKCILDCSEENIKFYEKCGFLRKGVQMGIYFTDSKL